MCTCDLPDTVQHKFWGEKFWRISDFKVLVRKTLVNAQHLYYWQEKNFGKSEGKSPFIKQSRYIGFLFLKKYLTWTSKG